MTINFSKYHGTGNDFVLINGFEQLIPELSQANIARICDRHLGVGADGLIILRPDTGMADFKMDYYNADGNLGSLCGNGGRCATMFAKAEGIVSAATVKFTAFDGLHTARFKDEHLVDLKMAPAGSIDSISTNDWVTDTGSPHVVRLVSDPNKVNVVEEGRKIRYSKIFEPGGTNVNFVSFRDREIQVRTYERGVEDETLSCGTGVVASALVVSKILARSGGFHIQTKGGKLEVNISPDGKDISLIGPAVKVFEGELNLEDVWAIV